VISVCFRRFWISVGHTRRAIASSENPRSLSSRLTVSEGRLEPVERPLDKTPFFRIGALQERTKPRLILITAQRVSPGRLTHDRRVVAA